MRPIDADALHETIDMFVWPSRGISNQVHNIVSSMPSADAGILHKLLAELTTKERTDRYHVWTTTEVKQWIADKITEMKNDG